MMTMIDRLIEASEGAVATLCGKAGRVVGRRLVANAHELAAARFDGLTVAVPLLLLLSVPVLLGDQIILDSWWVDFALPLDTSLRWAHGQVPHIDYQTPVGAAYWLIEGLATELVGVRPKSVVVANFLAAVPIALGGYLLARRRLSGGITGLFVLAVVSLVISPRAAGDMPGQVSFFAAYNKYGLAILAILLVTLFVEPRRAHGRLASAAEVGIVAFLLLWLIYLKVTFAAIAGAGALVALHYAPGNRRLVASALVVAALAVVGVGLLTGINEPYVRDLRLAAEAGPPFRWAKTLIDLYSSPVALFVLALSLVAYWRASGAEDRVRVANVVVTLGLFAASVLAMNQVHDKALPLTFAVLVVLAQRALGQRPAADDDAQAATRRLHAFVPPLLGATALVAIALVADLISVTFYHRYQGDERLVAFCDDPEAPACSIVYNIFREDVAERMAPFPDPRVAATAPSPPAMTPAGEGYATIMELYENCDADENCLFWKLYEQLFVMLDGQVTKSDRPYFLGFMNILPYYYQVAPPRHVLAWIDFDRNLSRRSHPDPEVLFSDVTLLVVPRVDFDLGWVPELEELYGADIARLFIKIAETETWTIWRRRDGGSRSPHPMPRVRRAHGARRPGKQDHRSGGRESGGAERQRAKGQGRIGGRACREAAAAGGEQVGNPVHPERMVDHAVGSVRPHRRGADDV
jgi:hypothetical protein